ncbi:hypothetical protein CK203_063644 [Vitis vinifera]|uniref:Uncharacterized protein n=1 Tax=Vitis vinifera TaxID=29760 RepID=A0A438G425_VITVI|nr:hypothetical protein CK203_063644 [Vitis vinifera]
MPAIVITSFGQNAHDVGNRLLQMWCSRPHCQGLYWEPHQATTTSKYILKDNNTQHGGDNNSRYEMVFDEDTSESPKREKRRQDHGPEDQIEKEKLNRRGSENWKRRDHDKKDSDDRHRQSDKGQESRASRLSGSRRDHIIMKRELTEKKHRERQDEGKRERDERGL